jgi:phospholipase C
MSYSRNAGYCCVVLLALLISACAGLRAGPGPTPSPTPTPAIGTGDIHSLNHIILMYQENRSFDHYFGNLNNYRKSLGLPTDVDVAPDGVTNLAGDNSGQLIARFQFHDKCIESLSPFWNESHRDFNLSTPTSSMATLDGFATVAGGFAQSTGEADVAGKRAMGFYTEQDLPYYYFMASQFATSDRWFSPVMNRTQPNRIFGLAATDAGFIYPPGNTGTNDPTPFPPIKNIFQLLEEANITWRIYSAAGSEDLAGLAAHTYLSYFQPFASQHASHIVSRAQFLTDVQNGTLAQVTLIEPDSADEHPNTDLQVGAKNVSTLMNAVMTSSSWKDSVFIFTYDEGGSFYDHVAPQPAVLPDNIPPRFLQPGDILGTYDHTGYRVPLIVVSPFAKKNFVSHTVMDYTAILKFIETRFALPNLTARDKAQPDMTEFFDFVNPPWVTPPPGIPTQPTTGPCTFLIP